LGGVNWTDQQASLLRSEKRELVNRLVILLLYLLKWEFQSERRSNYWRLSIKEQCRFNTLK
jgi:hypothetical protein